MRRTTSSETPHACLSASTPPVSKRKLIVGGMRSLDIKVFGKPSMKMHIADGRFDVTLTNVAFVPRTGFHLFSLHEAMPRCSAMMDASGVHMSSGWIDSTP